MIQMVMLVHAMLTIMKVIVISPPGMVMRAVFTGMVVCETVPVGMHVSMQMIVHHVIVFMGMGVQMLVKMGVLMLVLQGSNGFTAALAKCISQAVEIAKP
jgi:hypothetical protein